MAVSANTCYEVVNISWLKSLVGSAVQNDSGQTVNVSEKSGTTYCPTYKQLTNGTFIPYRSVSSDGPASDTDGITVKSTCHATGNAYADNQLVNKHDVAVCNTRLKTFTVSAVTTNLDACTGGTRDLSYTRTFTRNTWDMSDCETTYASHHSSTDVNDTRNNLISWTPSVGSITASTTAGSGKAVTVGKNKATSSSPSTRTVTITGSSTFRTTKTTATASVTQNAVTGGWVVNAYGDENFRANGVQASTSTSFACVGGSYGGMAKYYYDVRTYYVWRDNCVPQETYYSITKSEVKEADKNKTGSTKSKTDSFTDVTSTGLDNNTRSATLSWNGESYCGATWGADDVLTFTQTCYAPPASCANATGDSAEQTATVGCAPTSVTFSDITVKKYDRYVDAYNVCQTNESDIEVSTTVDVPCYSGASAHNITGTKNHIKYNITQNAGDCTCSQSTTYTFARGTSPEQSCGCAGNSSFTVTGGSVAYTAVTDNGDGTSSTTESSVSGISFNVNISKCEEGTCTTSTGASVSITSPITTSVTIDYTVKQTGCSQCSCDNVYGTATATTTTGGLTEIPASGGTYYFSSSTVPYSAYTSTPTAQGCSDCTYSSSAYTSFTTSAIEIPANDSTSSTARTGTNNHIYYNITQAGKSATCDNLVLDVSSIEFACGDEGATSAKYVSYASSVGQTNITGTLTFPDGSEGATNYFTLEQDTTNSRFKIYPIAWNDYHSEIPAKLTVKSTECTSGKAVSISHKAGTFVGYSYGVGTADTVNAACTGETVTVKAKVPFETVFKCGTTEYNATGGQGLTPVQSTTVTVGQCNDSCTTTGTKAVTSGSIYYTVSQSNCAIDCPSSGDIISLSSVAATGGTQTSVMQVLKNTTYTGYTITSTSSYVSNINVGAKLHDDWYVVLADVTANPNTTERNLNFKVIAKGPSLGTGCTYDNLVVKQAEGCPTSFLTGFTGTIGKDGGYCVALGRFKNNMTNYTTAITVTVSDGTTMGICSTASTWSEDSSWNLVQINVPANPNTTTRTITIECALTKGSKTCTESITITQNAADSCTCSDLTFEGVESDCPVMVSLYNDYGNVIYLEDIGLKVDGAWKYQQVDQDDGEIDYQKERVVAVLDYSTSDTNKTIQNASATIGQDSVNPGVEYCQMACSPTTISPGAVIRLTWDGDWSGSHHSCEDPGDGKIKVKVDLNDGTTSPAIHFVNSSNTQLLGVVRYTTDTETTGTWKVTSGTCTKIKLVEMGGNYTRVSVTIQKSGQAPISLISNGTLPSSSGSYLNLTNTFKVEDFYDSSTCTITITFR